MKKLVYFKAPWCGPCKMVAPLVEQYQSKFDVSVLDVDLYESQESIRKYEVKAVPTIIIFDGDKEIERFIGQNISKSALNKHV